MSNNNHILTKLLARCLFAQKYSEEMILDDGVGLPLIRNLYFKQDDQVYSLVATIGFLVAENNDLRKKLEDATK